MRQPTRRRTSVSASLVALACLLLLPATAWAQGQQGSITGSVRDETGAVLPGVTVQAASPALIERFRTVVTDGQGQYRIIELRPGTYSITFTLPGFSTVLREGIQLTGSFSATVDVQLQVGAVEETITVTGESPVVDIQNVVQQTVLTREIYDNIPTAKTITSLANLVPGMRSSGGSQVGGGDVGGSSGDTYVSLAIHGSRFGDQQIFVDGLRSNNIHGGGGGGGYSIYMNPMSVEEVRLDIGSISAEREAGGVGIHFIPKEGGNTFSGSFFSTGTKEGMQSDNLPDVIRDFGLDAKSAVRAIWDLNAAFGGPIVKDKLWFYTAHRWWGNENFVAGTFFDLVPDDWVYTPDLSRQALEVKHQRSNNIRFTWQADERNKFNLYYDNQYQCLCYQGIAGSGLYGGGRGGTAPEATQRHRYFPDYNIQAKWTAPLTSRLLVEAGASFVAFGSGVTAQPGNDLIAVRELSTAFNYRSTPLYAGPTLRFNFLSHKYNERFAVSYVTGSHAFQTGVVASHGMQRFPAWANGDMNFRFLNEEPRSVLLRTTPTVRIQNLKAEIGIFAQDKWTLDRLTLDLGVRFTYLNAYVPAQSAPAGTFVPVRNYDEVLDVPNWYDLSPRLAVAYDLTGTGRTALKASLNHYLTPETTSTALGNNPQGRVATSASRTWNDSNNNFVPDCALLEVAPNGECGRLSDVNFAQDFVRATTTTYDPDLLTGFGKRPYNWEISAGIEHEVMPGLGANVTYVRRWFGNFYVNDNEAVSPSDYDSYCITAPVDSRLPGGGGNEICGFFDLRVEKFGQFQNVITFADNFGTVSEVYNGVDLTVNARLRDGTLMLGGVSVGRTVFDTCEVMGQTDSPAGRFPFSISALRAVRNPSGVASPSTVYCNLAPPFQPDVKFVVVYPVPWGDLQVSANVQSSQGPELTASHVVTNAEVAPSLGRNLGRGVRGTATVHLIEPGTEYLGRINQTDFRVTKIFSLDRYRVHANFDVYNLFNANPTLAMNTRFGPLWQFPFSNMQGRLVKIGFQVDF